MAVFVCPNCSTRQEAPEEYIGRKARCLKCQTEGTVVKSAPVPQPKPVQKRKPAAPPELKLPPIQESGIGAWLFALFWLELTASVLGGFHLGQEDPQIGWAIFLGGGVSALIILGLASIVTHSNTSSQRLHRIELILLHQQSLDSNTASKT